MARAGAEAGDRVKANGNEQAIKVMHDECVTPLATLEISREICAALKTSFCTRGE